MVDVHYRIFGTYLSSDVYAGMLSSPSLCHLTVGTLKQWFPKEDKEKVEMASGTEVDEEQLEPRSDDDDT